MDKGVLGLGKRKNTPKKSRTDAPVFYELHLHKLPSLLEAFYPHIEISAREFETTAMKMSWIFKARDVFLDITERKLHTVEIMAGQECLKKLLAESGRSRFAFLRLLESSKAKKKCGYPTNCSSRRSPQSISKRPHVIWM